MTEIRGEEQDSAVRALEKNYYVWLGLSGRNGSEARKFALDQTLHPGSLIEIDNWDPAATPGKIADFVLEKAPEEAGAWLKDRRERKYFETNKHDERFRRVFGVKMALLERMRK